MGASQLERLQGLTDHLICQNPQRDASEVYCWMQRWLAKYSLAREPGAANLPVSRSERSLKLMRSSEKLIFIVLEIGRAIETGSEGRGFELAAPSPASHLSGV